MKTNLPVTNREVVLGDEDTIVTKTDLKGIITYANKDFCRISGFSLDELLGKNHNMVRHPDMPPEAFADLWATLRDGRPWSGLVKNRCKNGDFYWVRAEVAPIEENGTVVGYASFRAKPGRDEVAAAEQLYRQINQGTASVRLNAGHVVSTRLLDQLSPLRWLNSLRIAAQLRLLIGLFLLALAFTGISQMMVSKPLAVGGEIYTQITDDNGLLADALPPPLYMVESYLVALRMVESDASALPTLVQASTKLRDELESRHKYWQQHLKSDNLKQLEHQDYLSGADFLDLVQRQLVPALQSGHRDDARQLLPLLERRYESHKQAVDALVSAATADRNQMEAHATYVTASTNMLLALTGALVIILAVVSWIVLRNVMRFGDPEYVAAIIRQIASGNLAILIKDSGDPGSLPAVVRHLRDGLRKLVGVAVLNAECVQAESHQMVASADQASTLTREQGRSTELIAASVEEMACSISQVASNSSEAQTLSVQSSEVCAQGATVIRNAVRSMEQIASTVRGASTSISLLGEQSEKISSVVSVIRDIAEQTNLLALNAAIEAARAGDQGRGFAVVADEVRKLAERTSQATKEIAAMINAIQGGMQNAVSSMEDGVKQVDHGVALANDAGESIHTISESSVRVTQVVAEISQALNEQRAASENIARHIEQIAAAAHENSEVSQQSSASAHNLEQTALVLQGAVARFVV